MDKLVIEGNGPLHGTVAASGAKNAALPMFCAALLAPGVTTLTNIPDLRDIRTVVRIVESLGAKVTRIDHHTYRIDATGLTGHEAPYELVKTMRASCLTLGPLAARLGRARVSLPGGCAIGERPIDQHLKGLEALGASIEVTHGYVDVTVPRRLTGARIVMDLVTVTGVMNILMAAVLADGTTVIENAAREPEVTALCEMLTAMGARIEGAGTAVLRVEGVAGLRPVEFANIPDRIEAGTFLTAAAMTRGDVTVTGIEPQYLAAVTAKLARAGCLIEEGASSIRLAAPDVIRPVDVTTAPYPGFATDMQAQHMALMTIADGASTVTETIFENRFMHVAELRRMGADIAVNGRTATVRGIKRLSGADVMATDLRASASLVVAGLAAEGITTVHRVYHLDRGYERMEEKLAALGAKIRREGGDGP